MTHEEGLKVPLGVIVMVEIHNMVEFRVYLTKKRTGKFFGGISVKIMTQKILCRSIQKSKSILAGRSREGIPAEKLAPREAICGIGEKVHI